MIINDDQIEKTKRNLKEICDLVVPVIGNPVIAKFRESVVIEEIKMEEDGFYVTVITASLIFCWVIGF